MSAKVLVNASTLVVGGGIQIGMSFIEYAGRLQSRDFDFVFAVSRAVYDNLPPDLQNDPRLHRLEVSPARVVKGHAARSALKRLEREFQPHIVYTLGLPSYTRFQRPEIGRYTNPWEIYPTPLAWSLLPPRERLAVRLRTQLGLWWARRATFFETQTEAAQAGIARRLHVARERIKVIPNSPNPLFLSAAADLRGATAPGERICLFCLGAPFRHKNLVIIPEVAARLKRSHPHRSFVFVLTIPEDAAVWRDVADLSDRLGVRQMIENVGPLRVSDCVRWYGHADIVFLPTVLEVFSATYVEAMAMGRPIVTSDLDFARAVCGDAALYYDPESADAAAAAISSLITDDQLHTSLVERGRARLATFPDPQRKHQMVLEWLRDVVRGLERASTHEHV